MQVSDKLIKPLSEIKYLWQCSLGIRTHLTMELQKGIFLYQILQMDLEIRKIVIEAREDFRKNIILCRFNLHKGEFHYWHMDEEDYEIYKSDEKISQRRMKMLERITDERLKPLAKAIEKYGTSGYQEKLLSSIIS